MLDEEMDDMIREAAQNHHPPYNDKAWEKMEAQLDKHLPQKTDRRRLIFFLLFFLLLGGGIIFFAVNKFSSDKDIASGKIPSKNAKDIATDESLPQKTDYSKDGIQTPENSNGDVADQINTEPGNDLSYTDPNKIDPGNTNPANANPGAGKSAGIDPGSNSKKTILLNNLQKKNDKSNAEKADDILKRSAINTKGKTKIKIINANPFEETQDADLGLAKNKPGGRKVAGKTTAAITGAVAETNENEGQSSNSTAISNKENIDLAKNKNVEPLKDSLKAGKDKKETELVKTNAKSTSSADKKKAKQSMGSNFGLTFSVGPDLSFVGLDKLGKVTSTYGAGLSYNFAKHFTARAGLYLSKKIYAATPDQYHNVIYPNLTSVDANCKVLEIPVSLSYNFGQRKRHNWFGNAGLSSFIMKKEDYVYNYKTPGGRVYTYGYGLSNENKHYFAVLTLSGGYNYHLNKRVSIQAEPYMKLPLSGIGLGKIKLNSSGVLFTLTVKPFAKKK